MSIVVKPTKNGRVGSDCDLGREVGVRPGEDLENVRA